MERPFRPVATAAALAGLTEPKVRPAAKIATASSDGNIDDEDVRVAE